MNCVPVVEMEMRSASRRTWTFGLRLTFALVGAGTCLVVLILPHLSAAQKGRTMLVLLSSLGLLFCLAAGGFLTADCISSEKREGTLGLLFLTPLTGMDIVLGKIVCHALQMFYGVCAAFPVFFLPMLTGGVTWAEVSRTVVALGLALFFSASTGMLVSVLGTESRRTILTTLAGTVLLAATPMLYLLVRSLFLRGLPAAPARLSTVFTLISGFDSNYRNPGGPGNFWGSLFVVAGVGLFFLIVSGFLVMPVFRKAGAQGGFVGPPRARKLRAPVGQSNPYEWAVLRNADEGRSAGVLVTFLVAFFALMLLTSLITNHWQEGFVAAFFTALTIHVLSKLRLAVEATRQINADRQSGALELLLVTPLPEKLLLDGHRHALREIARRPFLLLVSLNLLLETCVVLAPGRLHMDAHDKLMFTTLFIGGIALAATDFSAMRWGAFLKGLKPVSHVRAAMQTFGLVMILPWMGLGLTIAFLNNARVSTSVIALSFLVWIGSSLLYDFFVIQSCRFRLRGGLRRLAAERTWGAGIPRDR